MYILFYVDLFNTSILDPKQLQQGNRQGDTPRFKQPEKR